MEESGNPRINLGRDPVAQKGSRSVPGELIRGLCVLGCPTNSFKAISVVSLTFAPAILSDKIEWSAVAIWGASYG